MDVKSTIYISNLGNTVTQDHLHSLFITYGPISNIMVDAKNGSAHIQYQDVDDAEAAIDNAHLSQILGRTITVKRATKEIN